MKLVGITAMKNEEGIAEAVLRHHFEQGVSTILAYDSSTDGTRAVLADLVGEGRDLVVLDDKSPYLRQPDNMNELVVMACDLGADWIVPFDADEFIVACDRDLTVKQAIERLPAEVGILSARMYRHLDWQLRCVDPKPLPKMVFEAHRDARVTMGQHGVAHPTHARVVEGVLEVREIQFRSWEHYKAKVGKNIATIRPDLGPEHATHYRVLDGLGDEALYDQWMALATEPTVIDPIPGRSCHLVRD